MIVSAPAEQAADGHALEAACEPGWLASVARLFFRAEVTGYKIWKTGEADGKPVGEVFGR